MEYLSAYRIKVTGKFTIEKIINIKIIVKTNVHPTIYVKGIIPANIGMEEIKEKCFKEPIKVIELDEYGKEKEYGIFEGIILNAKVKEEGNFYEIEINGISSSYLFDIEKKKRSFQNVSMTYAQVIKEAIGSNQVICTIGQDRQIGIPLIQYNETDWEFARRLASHFNKPIQSDILTGNPRIWFGVRFHNQKQKEYEKVFRTNTYNICISSKYYEIGKKLGLSKIYYITYKIKDGRNLHIGDKILFQDKKLIICEKEVIFEKGELIFYYTLAREEYLNVVEYYNKLFTGLTLLGEVIKTSSEKVWLKLDIDGKNGQYDYKWKPTSGSLMYCMPKLGTKASLYFESADERSGIATNSPRTNGGNDEKSEVSCEGFSNVQNRGMVTEHNKRMDMYPSTMKFSGTSNTNIPLEILFDDEKGIKIESNKIIDIMALGNINIESKTKILGYTEEEIKILRTAKYMIEVLSSIIPKGTYIMSKELNEKKALVDLGLVYSNNDTTIEIANEINVISYKVYIMQGEEYFEYELFNDEPKKHLDVGGLLLNVLGGIAIAAVVGVGMFAIGVLAVSFAGAAIIGVASIFGTAAATAATAAVSAVITPLALKVGVSMGTSAFFTGLGRVADRAFYDICNQQTSELGDYLLDAMATSIAGGIRTSLDPLGIISNSKLKNLFNLKPKNKVTKALLKLDVSGDFIEFLLYGGDIYNEVTEFFGIDDIGSINESLMELLNEKFLKDIPEDKSEDNEDKSIIEISKDSIEDFLLSDKLFYSTGNLGNDILSEYLEKKLNIPNKEINILDILKIIYKKLSE